MKQKQALSQFVALLRDGVIKNIPNTVNAHWGATSQSDQKVSKVANEDN